MPSQPAILTIDAKNIAQLLTLHASDLYNHITLTECELWQSLSSLDVLASRQTPAINAVIQHSNDLQHWVRRTLECSRDFRPGTEGRVLTHVVSIANYCLTFNNFSTLFSMVSALDDEHILSVLPSIGIGTERCLTHLRTLVSPTRGFVQYRRTVRAALLPCIPFLGLSVQSHSLATDLIC